jgi:hypothetical protein
VMSRRWLRWERPYLHRIIGYVTSIRRALRSPQPRLS